MPITPIIEYQKIADAQAFYASKGFVEIPVPWIVQYEAYGATRPPDRKEFYTLDGYLNASGEQGFIELMLDGTTLTKQCCVTACFREEPELDTTHQRYFVKLELIDMDVSQENLHSMISTAKEFFDRYVPSGTEVVRTGTDSFDIVDQVHGIELGSYGIRTYKTFTWIYGTGIALPRLDFVINN